MSINEGFYFSPFHIFVSTMADAKLCLICATSMPLSGAHESCFFCLGRRHLEADSCATVSRSPGRSASGSCTSSGPPTLLVARHHWQMWRRSHRSPGRTMRRKMTATCRMTFLACLPRLLGGWASPGRLPQQAHPREGRDVGNGDCGPGHGLRMAQVLAVNSGQTRWGCGPSGWASPSSSLASCCSIGDSEASRDLLV